MSGRHLSIESLSALLEREPEKLPAAERSHFEGCDVCHEEAESLREMLAALREPEPTGEAPVSPLVQQRIDELQDIEARLEADVLIAKELVERERASSSIRLALDREGAARTPGLVRVLIDRSEAERGEAPAAALETVRLAVDLAASLRAEAAAPGLVTQLHGLAEKEQANVLGVLGRIPEAFDALTRAEVLLAQGAAPEWDLAGCNLVRGTLEMHNERFPSALEAYAAAEQVFLAHGDDKRVAHARMMSAAALAESGDADRAARALRQILESEDLDPDTRSQVLSNLGNCELDRGDFAKAQEAWEQAASISSALDGAVAAAQLRWHAGSLLAARGELPRGLEVLNEARSEFLRLELPQGTACVSLEIVEVLLALGRVREAGWICRNLPKECLDAGLQSNALTALSFLRECEETGRLTAPGVRHVREYLDRLEKEPELLFAPPLR